MLNIKKTINGYESVFKGVKEFVLLPVADYEKLLMKIEKPGAQEKSSLIEGAEQALACSDEFKVLSNNRQLTPAYPMPELSRTGGIPRFLKVSQVPKFYGDAFTENTIRNFIFHERTNGFYQCVSRVGRKVLINTDKFNEWIESEKQDPIIGRKQNDWERRGQSTWETPKHLIDPKKFGAI